MSVAFKNRSREEIIAAFRESIRKKQEWEEQAKKELSEMRKNQLVLSL